MCSINSDYVKINTFWIHADLDCPINDPSKNSAQKSENKYLVHRLTILMNSKEMNILM